MDPKLAAAHREAFMSAMEGGAAVLRTGPERVRNRDAHYRFRPDSDFWYLTAFPEPDAVAVLRPDRDDERFVLFVRPRDPEMEVWNGRRAGVEGACDVYGADVAYPIEALDEKLPELLKGIGTLYCRTGEDQAFDAKLLGWLQRMYSRTRDGVTGPTALVEVGTLLHELRLIKGPAELDAMRRAARITEQAHRAAMAHLRPGVHEYEIEALVDGTFRREGGWGPGYNSICAAGANATVLHYTTNAEQVRPRDLMLLDAGCEFDGYTADVTRCFPADDHFSRPQADLYRVVLAAQVHALEHVQPGHTFHSVHDEAVRVLVEGMIDLGLLAGDVDENIESEAYRRYYMHRTGHWLGLDVHDVGSYYRSDRTSRPLAPGMVLTVEPGLYVAADDEQAPEAFRGIGIRIEDDVVVTADGHEVLTAGIPKTIEDIEAVR